jgi:hypothetical protein
LYLCASHAIPSYILCEYGVRIIGVSAIDFELFEQLFSFCRPMSMVCFANIREGVVRCEGSLVAARSAFKSVSILVTSSSFAAV